MCSLQIYLEVILELVWRFLVQYLIPSSIEFSIWVFDEELLPRDSAVLRPPGWSKTQILVSEASYHHPPVKDFSFRCRYILNFNILKDFLKFEAVLHQNKVISAPKV